MREHIEGITPEEEFLRMFVKHAGFFYRQGKMTREQLLQFCKHPLFRRVGVRPSYIYLHIRTHYEKRNKNRDTNI